MEVTNIIVIDNKINYENTIFKDLLNNNKHLFPNKLQKTLSFKLSNCNIELANAIRRIITNELEIKILKVNITDVNTDDKYILPDLIKDRIELISIDQNIPNDCKFKLTVSNNTLDITNITSNDLILLNHKELNIKNLFNTNIIICYLNSNKYITINDIIIHTDTGYNNGKYSLCSVKYDIINTDFKIPTLNNNNTDFQFKIKTNGNIEPIKIINLVEENLNKRLDIIENNINKFNKIYNSNDKQLLDTNDLYIIKNYDIYNYYINNESHTIGNLLVRYIYDLEPTIELINYTIPHPSKNQFILNIKHSDHNKLLINAINKIKKDIKLFKSYF